MVVTSGQQYNVGETFTVILYTTYTLLFSHIQRCCCLKKNQNAPRPSEHPPVDSHLQRIVLATEETTVVTQQVSHRPIKSQSRVWSQRGTKVNGSHHQPATQTNRDPNRDKKLCGSTCNGTNQYQNGSSNLRYFQRAHFVPIVGVGKRSEY